RGHERGAELFEPRVIVTDEDHTGRGGAVLPARAECGTGDVSGDGIEVTGVLGVDDVGCPPAQFEGDLLEVRLRGGFEEGASDWPGPGEGEHVDVGMQPHGGADVRAGAGGDG